MSLTNPQFEEIQYEYDLKRDENRRTLTTRKQKLFACFPRLKEIDDSISKISVDYTKNKILGRQSDMDLSSELESLKCEREKILTDAGYSSDYLEMHYDCPDCRDSGYIGGEKCHCLIQRIIDLVYSRSNLSDSLSDVSFDSFSLDYYRETRKPNERVSPRQSAEIALSHSKKFVESFDTLGGNLLFRGGTGLGKTFLSGCVAKSLLDTGHSVVYFTSSSLFDIFARYRFHRDDDAAEQNHIIFDCDLLIIDDLGTEVRNNFTVSQLFILLNERLNRSRSTIISTNISIGDIAENYSERIFSRISSSYSILELLGDDIRIQKKLESRG